ncbi:MAG: ubiquinol-cytochrome c reductase iron-sulfur subunit [Anaerolineales bacterium]
MDEYKKEEKIDRSDFMKATIVGVGGLIGVAYGLPAIAYVVGPASKQEAGEWIELGAVSKIEMNTPTLFKTVLETQTGWISTQEEISAYVLTENGQDFTVLSNVCTHLGCRVRWIEDEDKFFCPCHNGAFSKKGTVIGGPPPRPLDTFENKVEDGILYIRRGG